MRVKTITCHHVFNYGASLQAYALQHYMESLGHEVEIIDFNPWFHRDRYNPFWISKNAKGKIASLVRILPFMRYVLQPIKAYRCGMFDTWRRKSAFEQFEHLYYNLTKIKYSSSKELQSNPPQADIYIAGSDQIWNTYSNNGKEPGYYLDFGSKSIKRISYAASLATDNIKDGYKKFVLERLKNFDAISVREETGAQVLNQLGLNDIDIVLDPVFLLDKYEWRALAKKGKKYDLPSNRYLLVYDFLGNDEHMISFIKSYAKEKSLMIVSINDFSTRSYADVNINDAGPLEFLSLIYNAACVVASSFHATAFSVIFEKEFYTFNLVGHNNSSRMHDFLSLCGLTERMNPQINHSQLINWKEVSGKLCTQIIKSKDFLIKICHIEHESTLV